MDMQTLGREAKATAHKLAALSTKEKNNALLKIADSLQEALPQILAANALDLEQARANNILIFKSLPINT